MCNFPNVHLRLLRAIRGAAGCKEGGASTAVRGPRTVTRTDLGSCHCENYTFGKLALGKNHLGELPLKKMLLRKYLSSPKEGLAQFIHTLSSNEQ